MHVDCERTTGMESGFVLDEQLSASSSLPRAPATRGRLNLELGKCYSSKLSWDLTLPLSQPPPIKKQYYFSITRFVVP